MSMNIDRSDYFIKNVLFDYDPWYEYSDGGVMLTRLRIRIIQYKTKMVH